jgi:hypothetical protein
MRSLVIGWSLDLVAEIVSYINVTLEWQDSVGLELKSTFSQLIIWPLICFLKVFRSVLDCIYEGAHRRAREGRNFQL